MQSDSLSALNQNPVDPRHRAQQANAQGYALFAQRHFQKALVCFQEAIKLAPDDLDLRYNLACATWATGDIASTQAHLLRIIESSPTFPKARDALARLLHHDEQPDAAYQHSCIATQLNPREPEFSFTHATVLESLNRNHEAGDIARFLLKNDALRDRATTLIVRIASKSGQADEAIQILNATLAQPPSDQDFRRQLHFTAAAFFEKLDRYDQAFAHAEQAHRCNTRPYNPALRASEFDRRISHWTPQNIASIPGTTHGSTRPVFIVGMPRSGTSLVEQILGCHPDVFPAGELDTMNRTAKALDSLGLAYPQSLSQLTIEQANRVAAVYLDFIGSLNRSSRYVTDKMPLNFMYLDLIHALLPESRIIHCTRDPLDTCVSLFMTEFEIPYDFAEDLKHLGAFYTHYKKLMDHWSAVLPLEILEVSYEDVVADTETQARRMLKFLGLPYDERCLRFNESARAVKTASRDQVRRPIYQSSVGRWKHYSRHLAPLREGLGEASA